MDFPMNPALSSAPAPRLSLLALLLLAVSCSPVDPEEALLGLSDRCRTDESCAPGFVCENLRCVGGPGQACREGFDSALCPNQKTLDGRFILLARHGVCEGARLACVNGVYEQSCSNESFGPDFEPDETRCDGLDNDCDGTVDRGPCERTLGVCAGAARGCPGGQLVRQCGAESYGPAYQALESRCDGLDNDCDGVADVFPAQALSFFDRADLPLPAPPPAPSVYENAQSRVVPFGAGYLGITASTVTTSFPSQETQASTRPNEYRSTLKFQPLDASLRPLTDEPALLYTGERDIQDLQLVPYDGGVFLLWYGLQITVENGQPSYSFESFLARIDVGASATSPSVGIAPRAPPNNLYGGAFIRAAVSRDSQQLLLAWNVGQVRAQLFSRDLEPQSEVLVLDAPHPEDAPGAYLSRLAVSTHGDAGFALAWALVPPTVAGEPPAALQLRFRRFTGALQPVGEVVGVTDTPGTLTDLRVLGAAQSDEALFATWQISPPFIPPAQPTDPTPPQDPPTLRYAWPFAPGTPVSERLAVDYGSGRISVARDASEQVLLVLPHRQRVPALRRFEATRSYQEQPLLVPSMSTLQTVSLLFPGEADRWSLVINDYDGTPRSLSVCRF
jgi:hypothetical protein